MNQASNLLPDEQAQRIAYLVTGYIRKTLTKKEHDELDHWVEASDKNMLLFEQLTDETTLADNLRWLDKIQVEHQLHKAKKGVVFNTQKRSATVSRMLPLLAVAAIILSLVIGGYIFQNVPEGTAPQSLATEIIPPANKTVLILEDGTEIPLNLQKTFRLDSLNTITTAGGLDYSTLQSPSSGLHTLSTAAGSTYQLTLSDGSKVWLNAGSSIKYPVAFAANERSGIEQPGSFCP